MRGSKYHDYRVVKVIGILLLIALGVFLYFQFREPPHEHTPLSAVKERVVQATCTEGGSYDSVIYCAECGDEIARNKVEVDPIPHTPGQVKQENLVNPTCTENGSYDDVTYCTVCNTKTSTITKTVEPTGHEYEFGLVYSELDGQLIFEVIGICHCEDVISLDNESEEYAINVYREEDACLCEPAYYYASFTYDGETLECRTEEMVAPEHSHTIYEEIDWRGEVCRTVYIEDIPVQTDANGNIYYLYEDVVKYDEFGNFIPYGFRELENDNYKGHTDGFYRYSYYCVVCEKNKCDVCNIANRQIVIVYCSKLDQNPDDAIIVPN